jgi:hypothetical protein
MEERRKNPSDIPCVWHTGLDERINGLCKKVDEREKQFNLQIDSLRDSIVMAKVELDKRLNNLNELRKEVMEDRSTLVPMTTFNLRREQLDVWKSAVDQAITKLETRSITWGAAIALAVIILNTLMHYWKL